MNMPASNHVGSDLGSHTWTQTKNDSPPKSLLTLDFQCEPSENFGLIETAKLNQVEPTAYLADVLTKLVKGWPASRIDELLPWAYVKPRRAAVA
jgi:hypothetical protein